MGEKWSDKGNLLLLISSAPQPKVKMISHQVLGDKKYPKPFNSIPIPTASRPVNSMARTSPTHQGLDMYSWISSTYWWYCNHIIRWPHSAVSYRSLQVHRAWPLHTHQSQLATKKGQPQQNPTPSPQSQSRRIPWSVVTERSRNVRMGTPSPSQEFHCGYSDSVLTLTLAWTRLKRVQITYFTQGANHPLIIFCRNGRLEMGQKLFNVAES